MSNKQIIAKKTRAIRELFKRIPLSGDGSYHGFTTKPDGQEEVYFETEMDWDALSSLAVKAAGNKSGKSSDGPITVRITERRRLEALK